MGSRRKPLVGVIHSGSLKSTTAGEDLAVYIGVCLQLGGYSDVRIVSFNSDTKAKEDSRAAGSKPHARFSVVPYGGSKPTYPNHAECCRDGWESLAKCNVVLICVDPADTSACCEALSAVIEKGGDVAIVGFDLGVRNHLAVERHLGSHGVVLLGGAVGISVARSPVDAHLRCLGGGSLVIERLSKQQSKRGVKFVNLLRSGGIPILHCKNISSYTHGAIVFNTVHAAAALAGVPLRDLVRDRQARLLWAAMIREALQATTLAARGGDWRVANPCCSLSLPQLELFLCLPTPVFDVVSRLLLRFPPMLAPVMQKDLALGRETSVEWTLGEIVRIADKYKAETPACRSVLAAVKLCVSTSSGVPCTSPRALATAAEISSKGSDSARALRHKLIVWGCGMVAGATALGLAHGAWLAGVGVLVALLAVFVKYALVGDVVP